jgi:hypothetical protein
LTNDVEMFDTKNITEEYLDCVGVTKLSYKDN